MACRQDRTHNTQGTIGKRGAHTLLTRCDETIAVGRANVVAAMALKMMIYEMLAPGCK